MQIVDYFFQSSKDAKFALCDEMMRGMWKYMGESVTVISASGIYYDK